MTQRDRAQVIEWLSDFWDTNSLFDQKITVVDDGYVPSSNSGLVVTTLSPSGGVAYLSVSPVDGHPTWRVTFEPRSTEITVDRSGVEDLAREIGALGILCQYLQARTDDAIRRA